MLKMHFKYNLLFFLSVENDPVRKEVKLRGSVKCALHSSMPFLPHNFYLHWQNNGACSLLKLSLVQHRDGGGWLEGGLLPNWMKQTVALTFGSTFVYLNYLSVLEPRTHMKM